jgi:hypothetical protein
MITASAAATISSIPPAAPLDKNARKADFLVSDFGILIM